MTPRPPGTASDPESPHIWLQLARVCFTFCTQTTTLAAIRGGPACSVHGQGVGGGAGGGGGGRASARSPGPRVRAAPVFVSVPPAARVHVHHHVSSVGSRTAGLSHVPGESGSRRQGAPQPRPGRRNLLVRVRPVQLHPLSSEAVQGLLFRKAPASGRTHGPESRPDSRRR